MSEPRVTEVVYKSGIHETEHWEVMQVVYKSEGNIVNSFVIGRAADGTIRRKTDIVLEAWEIVTDAEDLRIFRGHFDHRDRLAGEKDNPPAINTSP